MGTGFQLSELKCLFQPWSFLLASTYIPKPFEENNCPTYRMYETGMTCGMSIQLATKKIVLKLVPCNTIPSHFQIKQRRHLSTTITILL